jgi:hypothetical protein
MGQVFTEYFGFLCNSFYQLHHIHHLEVADVPSELISFGACCKGTQEMLMT